MSDFVRPEVREMIWRWREALFGALAVLLGLYWATSAGGVLGVLGGILMLCGATLIFMGIQRARFRATPGSGPGTVDVDEGQITYFGPMTGGAMAMRDMTELALIRTRQTPHWRLSAHGDQLFIPTDADGSDALFDAFTALPGLNTERMLGALKETGAHDTVIWERTASRGRLH